MMLTNQPFIDKSRVVASFRLISRRPGPTTK
jgi:hypothetical protein